jgi:hypothetical protein
MVSDVTGAGGMPVPEPTRDLPDSNRAHREQDPPGGPGQLGAEDRGSSEFEEDWEFNDDSSQEMPAAAPPEARPEPSVAGGFDATALEPPAEPAAAPLEAKPEPSVAGGFDATALEPPAEPAETEVADSLGEPEPETPPAQESPQIDPVEAIRARDAEFDLSFAGDLGRPEEWNFVGKAEPQPPVEFPPVESLPEESAPELDVSVTDEAGAAPASPALADSPTAAPAVQQAPDRIPLASRLLGLASVGGWIVVALAFSLGISAVFSQPAKRSAVSAGPVEIPVSGLPVTATEVKGRLIENALAGNLLVVSGNLENRGSSLVTPRRAVWVQLVSADGEAIEGATAAAGRALDERSLREQDPDRLRRHLERSAAERAHRPLRPGERVRFDAVFDSVPESAAGWVLESASQPSYPAPADLLPSSAPLVSE